MFVIENVPATETLYGGSPRGGRRTVYPFAHLGVGQSFLVPTERAHTAAVAASYYKTRNPGWNYTRQAEDAGVRFFRIA